MIRLFAHLCLLLAVTSAVGCARNTVINQALALAPREEPAARIPLAKIVPDEARAEETAVVEARVPAGGIDHATFLEALAHVERLGRRDADAQSRLIDDLRHTEPALIAQLLDARQTIEKNDSELPGRFPMEPSDGPAMQLAKHETGKPVNRFARPIPESNADEYLPVAAWQETPPAPPTLEERIRQIEQQVSAAPTTPEDLRAHLELRLMYLAVGRTDDALQPIPGVEAAEQQLWQANLEGLAMYLQATDGPIPGQWTTQIAEKLDRAALELGRQGPLVVKRLALCRRIDSFGVFEPFPVYQFQAGQEILLYIEIDRFTSRSTPEGFHTELESRYEITNARGQVVSERVFPATIDLCRNRRRDYFHTLRFAWPGDLKPGDYTLRVTVRDLHSSKTARAAIEFTIDGQ